MHRRGLQEQQASLRCFFLAIHDASFSVTSRPVWGWKMGEGDVSDVVAPGKMSRSRMQRGKASANEGRLLSFGAPGKTAMSNRDRLRQARSDLTHYVIHLTRMVVVGEKGRTVDCRFD